MTKKIVSLLCMFLFLATEISTVQAEELRLGVVASRGALKAKAKWTPFATYLGSKTNTTVRLIPLTPDKVSAAVAGNSIDFMLGNPVITTILVEKHGVKPVATIKKKSGSQFAGVIIANKTKGISNSADLKGKKVMAFKFGSSAAAYVFQVYHMKKNGIDPFKDFSVFKEAKKQDDIVLAVKSGIFDAGFIKSGLLEAMGKEGKIKINDFVIVDKKSDSLKDVHSTILYPQWYLVAGSKVSSSQFKKVKQAVLSLKASDPAAKKAKIKGFVKPLNLADMKATLKALHLPPYK